MLSVEILNLPSSIVEDCAIPATFGVIRAREVLIPGRYLKQVFGVRSAKSGGFKVSVIKMDPYLNVDAGTMNPLAHGETFVLDDGKETDQDLGHYERFMNESLD